MIQVYSNEGKFFPPRNGEMIMKKWKYTNVCDVYINNFIPPEPHNIFYQTLLKAFILTWRGIKWAVTFQAESELWKFGDYIWFFSTLPPPLSTRFLPGLWCTCIYLNNITETSVLITLSYWNCGLWFLFPIFIRISQCCLIWSKLYIFLSWSIKRLY